MAGDSNQGTTAGIAVVQRKLAGMNGVPVEQIVKIRMAGGPAMPQMSAAQAARMQDAMAKLKSLPAQGGPGATAGGAGNSMLDMTMESTDFSTSSIPDSVFTVPFGYQSQPQVTRRETINQDCERNPASFTGATRQSGGASSESRPGKPH
jgi:hypothetical protein